MPTVYKSYEKTVKPTTEFLSPQPVVLPTYTGKQTLTMQDFLLQFGTFITNYQENIGVAGYGTIYTVPAGKVFFLINAQASYAHNYGDASAANMWLSRGTSQSQSTSTGLLGRYFRPSNSASAAVPFTANASLTPPLPIKFSAGTIFWIYTNSSNGSGFGVVNGYEVSETNFNTYEII